MVQRVDSQGRTLARTTRARRALGRPAARAASQAVRSPGPKPPLLASLNVSLRDATRRAGGALRLPGTVAEVPVTSARREHFVGLAGNLPLHQQCAEVRFGTLSRRQFDSLSAEFGGRSQVPYDAKREYAAVDFLPPALQALVGKNVDLPQRLELKATAHLRLRRMGNVMVGVSPNCHGTAWEAMRAYQRNGGTFAFAFGEEQNAAAAYAKKALFRPLTSARVEKHSANRELRAGDLLVFREPGAGPETASHSAVYVGGNLFFEKPETEYDSLMETPYRLATFEQVVAPLTEKMGQRPTMSALRPVSALPETATVFGGPASEQVRQWAASKSVSLGRPLTVEYEFSSMGVSLISTYVNANDERRVALGADGRGVIGSPAASPAFF